MQKPANSGTGPDGAGAEAGPVRALSETSPASQQIKVELHRADGGAVVLEVTGEIDLLTASYLGERLRDQLQPENPVLVLDLTQVSFLGSAGLAEIVAVSQAGADSGSRLVLVATNRAVLRPLEVTGLSSLLAVYETVAAALTANQP
ncbi:MAG TPA: STAS domain-containing protein [Actinophytocola sp.]|uniref:STAS domain-containing protein n=1 Tax=Actinophytocola sp. TaxID=1872138 RepID=UPI002DBA3815|nr:STAS domain-containing protein [Actinophytocola sp.]HEU5475356.1 STAS domain-containing protein [Actinophytocola sp.]